MIAEKFGVGVRLIDWPDMALKLESDDTVFNDEKIRRVTEITKAVADTAWNLWIFSSHVRNRSGWMQGPGSRGCHHGPR